MIYFNLQKILKNEGFKFKHRESVNSTMDSIKELFNTNNRIFLLADKQVEGRGRRGNIWHSPKGNIYFSLSFEILEDIKNHFVFNAITALTICQTIDAISNIKSIIKWPNDILIDKKKISGLISEIIK